MCPSAPADPLRPPLAAGTCPTASTRSSLKVGAPRNPCVAPSSRRRPPVLCRRRQALPPSPAAPCCSSCSSWLAAHAEYFSQFGKVTKVRLSRNKKSGKSKGYAFLEFSSAEVRRRRMNTSLLGPVGSSKVCACTAGVRPQRSLQQRAWPLLLTNTCMPNPLPTSHLLLSRLQSSSALG